MSTFSLFNTAYSGLAAARAALDVTGQNVANVNTAGYTRQRVEQASVAGSDFATSFTTGLNIGQGTTVTGISRLSDSLIDAQVRDTASSSGYWTATAGALGAVETIAAEPGDDGLSTSLNEFWNAWQGMAAGAGKGEDSSAAASTLLGRASALTARIAAGYSAADTAWSGARTAAAASVASVGQAGATVAALNDQILRITVRGGNANELMDQRSAALATLSALTGATTRTSANGSIDVLVGGLTFVSGGSVRPLSLVGSASLASAAASPVHIELEGSALQLTTGTLAAQLGSLAPAASGGVYAQTAQAYDDAATALATRVNAVHRTGATPDGTAGGDFFGTTGTGPLALRLSVVPASAAGIAAGRPGAGANDGSVADAIAQLATEAGGADAGWSTFVTGIGARSRAATSRADVATSAAASATSAQTSQSGVDLDEETANLVVFQHAYQGAARVLTAVDEMLDTLINHTGLVGRG